MNNSSVPHPFRVPCEKGGKPQMFGVRAFPSLLQKKVVRAGQGGWLAAPGSVAHEEVTQ